MPDPPSAPLPPPAPLPATSPARATAPEPTPQQRPPDVDQPTAARRVVPFRAGDLTIGWRVALIAAWVGAFVAYLAVWKASEEMGIHTWWLGPRADPQPMLIRLLPFIVCAVFGIVASSQLRRLPLISLVGALVLAGVAVPDVPIAVGLAVIEFAIAAAVALVSLASITGMYRAAPTADGR